MNEEEEEESSFLMQRALCSAVGGPNASSVFSGEQMILGEDYYSMHSTITSRFDDDDDDDDTASLLTSDSRDYGFFEELKKSLKMHNCTQVWKEAALAISERSFMKTKREIGAMLDAAAMEITSATEECSSEYACSHDQSSAKSDEAAIFHSHDNDDASTSSHRETFSHESSSAAPIARIRDSSPENEEEEATASVMNRSTVVESSVEIVNALSPPLQSQTNEENPLLAFHSTDIAMLKAGNTAKDATFSRTSNDIRPYKISEKLPDTMATNAGDKNDIDSNQTPTAILDYSTVIIEVAVIRAEKDSQSSMTSAGFIEPRYVTSVSVDSIEISIAPKADEGVNVASKTDAISTFFLHRHDSIDVSHIDLVGEHNSVSVLSDGEAAGDTTSVDQFVKANQARLQLDDDLFDPGCLPLESTVTAALPRASTALARLPKLFASCATVHAANFNAADRKKLETIKEDEATTNPSKDLSQDLVLDSAPNDKMTKNTVTPHDKMTARSNLCTTSNEATEDIEELEVVYKEEKAVPSKSSRRQSLANLFRRAIGKSGVKFVVSLHFKDKDLTDGTDSTPSTHDESSISSQPMMETDDSTKQEVAVDAILHMEERKMPSGKVNLLKRRSV